MAPEALIEALPQPWCVVNAHGEVVRSGSRWAKRMGEGNLLRSVPPAYAAELARRWSDGLQSSKAWSFEACWIKSSGESCCAWALLWVQPLDGALWLCTLTDTEAQKAAEAQLREADAVWKLALEAAGDGVWDWNLADNTELFSPNMLALYGYDPDEAEPTPAFFDSLTHPDDRDGMARDRQAHFEGREPLYRNEHRVRCKDGSYKWVLTRGMVIRRAADGTPLRMVGTHTDITERKASEVLAWKQANFDTLTGLPNRRMLADRLELALKKSQRSRLRLAVLMLDLDHFKAVNDVLGHDVGDTLLLEAAQRARGCVREVDMVARLGGDEFVVLLTDLGPSNEVIDRVASQLVRRLGAPYALPRVPADHSIAVGASVGIALYPDDARDAPQLLKLADQALYSAKRGGRGAFRYFTPALEAAAQVRARLGLELREALATSAFSLRFLPLRPRDAALGCQAEVQLRWRHPVLGELGPASFMPGAESSGLVHELGDWMLRETAQWLQRWRAELSPGLTLSVGLSGTQLRQWGYSVPDWTAALMRLGVSTGGLTLDVDEAQLSDPHTVNLLQLPALRGAGIELALDAFGEGRSSLMALRHPGLRCVKLARSLCQGPLGGAPGRWLSALIELAHAQGLQVMAKGVDNGSQARALEALGVDGWQGQWVSPALTPEAFEAWLRQAPRQP
jgi:diguanylate cyclase (GGDEF)-like protein/PAS domain S-box-containing protein